MRLGLVTKEQVKSFKDGAAAVDFLGKAYSGQALASANTFGGTIRELSATGQNFAATIGPTVIAIVHGIADAFGGSVHFLQDHVAVAKALALAFGALTVALVGSFVVQKVISLFEYLRTGLVALHVISATTVTDTEANTVAQQANTESSVTLATAIDDLATSLAALNVTADTLTGTGIAPLTVGLDAVGAGAVTAETELAPLGPEADATAGQLAFLGTTADATGGQLALFGGMAGGAEAGMGGMAATATTAVPAVAALTLGTAALAVGIVGGAVAVGLGLHALIGQSVGRRTTRRATLAQVKLTAADIPRLTQQIRAANAETMGGMVGAAPPRRRPCRGSDSRRRSAAPASPHRRHRRLACSPTPTRCRWRRRTSPGSRRAQERRPPPRRPST